MNEVAVELGLEDWKEELEGSSSVEDRGGRGRCLSRRRNRPAVVVFELGVGDSDRS